MATAVVLTVPGAPDSIVIRIECAADVLPVDLTCIGAVTVAEISGSENFDDDRCDWDTADDPFEDESSAVPW